MSYRDEEDIGPSVEPFGYGNRWFDRLERRRRRGYVLVGIAIIVGAAIAYFAR